MTCRPEEDLAAQVLTFELQCSFQCLDRGAQSGQVDLRLNAVDGSLLRYVEVSQAMDEHAKRLAAKWSQVHVRVEGNHCLLAEYFTEPSRDAEERLQNLIDVWLSAGVLSGDDLGKLGITALRRLEIGASADVVFVPTRAMGIDPDAAVEAVQVEVDKVDNRLKLERVGGGDLFLWMFPNRPAAFFGAAGLLRMAERLILPTCVLRVWIGLAVPNPAMGDAAVVIQLLSFTNEDGWQNHGHPYNRGFRASTTCGDG